MTELINVLEHDIDLYHYEYQAQGLPLIAYGKQIKIESDFKIAIDPNAPDTVFLARYYRSDRTPLRDNELPVNEMIVAPEGAKYFTLLFIRIDFEMSPLSYAKDNNIQVLMEKQEPIIKGNMNKVLFVSNRYIKDNSILERNLDDKILRQTIWEVQDIELRHILGKELYESLAVEVIRKNEDASYEIPEKYLDLLEVIRPFISYGVLTYISIPLTYKATNKGFAVSNDANASITEGSDLQYVMNYYKTKFDSYKERLAEEVGKSCSGFMEKDLGWSTGWYIQGNQKKRDKIDRVVNKY